jgi:hypothetical protein
MNRSIFLLILLWLFASGCDYVQKQQALQKKEDELNRKEQELLEKEKNLQLKEQELVQKERQMDTTIRDTVDSITYNPELIGHWSVKMNCIETSCPGSAVGDTKTEQWDISYQNNFIVASSQVSQGAGEVRIYSGSYKGNTIELTIQHHEDPAQPAASIVVRLEQTAKERLEGRREITRAEGCKIIYALEMVKL